ncbi:hypothetical protein C2E23DRAFT_801812 [Lenzites betulinus]|nr:hypothetical protein C2E23DRAFT_801812 [Lenzites betulinus]
MVLCWLPARASSEPPMLSISATSRYYLRNPEPVLLGSHPHMPRSSRQGPQRFGMEVGLPSLVVSRSPFEHLRSPGETIMLDTVRARLLPRTLSINLAKMQQGPQVSGVVLGCAAASSCTTNRTCSEGPRSQKANSRTKVVRCVLDKATYSQWLREQLLAQGTAGDTRRAPSTQRRTRLAAVVQKRGARGRRRQVIRMYAVSGGVQCVPNVRSTSSLPPFPLLCTRVKSGPGLGLWTHLGRVNDAL